MSDGLWLLLSASILASSANRGDDGVFIDKTGRRYEQRFFATEKREQLAAIGLSALCVLLFVTFIVVVALPSGLVRDVFGWIFLGSFLLIALVFAISLAMHCYLPYEAAPFDPQHTRETLAWMRRSSRKEIQDAVDQLKRERGFTLQEVCDLWNITIVQYAQNNKQTEKRVLPQYKSIVCFCFALVREREKFKNEMCKCD